VKCFGFLDQENVWRTLQIFQNCGNQILILHLFLSRRNPAQFCGLMVFRGLTNSKKTVQIFPPTTFFAFRIFIAQLKQAGVQEVLQVEWQRCW